ncbi:sorting nexin-24 isoform X8 [Manis pentadactyla]|uniref:sorting nexin-24 isoform X8 n=1 Tax=Manis pentadactyla TaxID=143292 RepID=UPI00255C874A|nr:sorting nexin-24 isoform X8 [Manis pentadactyla]
MPAQNKNVHSSNQKKIKTLRALRFLAALGSVERGVQQTANAAPAEPRGRGDRGWPGAEGRTPLSADSRDQLIAAAQQAGRGHAPAPSAPAPGPRSPALGDSRKRRAAGRLRLRRGRRGLGTGGSGGRRGGGRELAPPHPAPRRPAGAAMEVYIPSFRYEESDLERGYTMP